MNVRIERLTMDHIPQMEYLEAVSWPEDVRAIRIKLEDRLRTFPEGSLGAFSGAHLIGMASCQIINHRASDPPVPWTALTADGWINNTHTADGNCLHFVSHCVHPEVRNRGIGTMLNKARLDLGSRLALSQAFTDARLPGLQRYLDGHPLARARHYVDLVTSGNASEPVVGMYLKLGFRVVGLVPNCMLSDAESANYGLALMKDLRPDV